MIASGAVPPYGQDLEVDAGVRVPALLLRDVEPGVVGVRRPVEREADLRRARRPTGGRRGRRRWRRRPRRATAVAGMRRGGRRRRARGEDEARGDEQRREGGAGAADADGHGRAVPPRDRTPPPGAGDGVGTERACFLHRYEPDQVPRVCGPGHTLSARALPGGGYAVVRRSLHRGCRDSRRRVPAPHRVPAPSHRSHATTSARTASCSGSWWLLVAQALVDTTGRVALALEDLGRPQRDDRVGRAVEDVGRHGHRRRGPRAAPGADPARANASAPHADGGRAPAQRVRVDLRAYRRVVRAAVVGEPVRELQLRHGRRSAARAIGRCQPGWLSSRAGALRTRASGSGRSSPHRT